MNTVATRIALASALLLVACAPATTPPNVDPAVDLVRAPAWVTDVGHAAPAFAALGSAPASTGAAELRRAALREAKDGVAVQVAAFVRPALAGIDDPELRRDALAAIVAANLRGPHRERYWIAPSGTCYVRFEIEPQTFVANVERLRSLDAATQVAVAVHGRSVDAASIAR